VSYTTVLHCEIGSRYRQNTSLVSICGIKSTTWNACGRYNLMNI